MYRRQPAWTLIFFAVQCLPIGPFAFAATAPMPPVQLALYRGADREKILIEGAKREGQFTLYTSHTWFKTFVGEFEKKYPFVRASQWRNDSKNIIRKVLEEVKAGRVLADIVETTADGMGLLRREGLFQEYYSPEARYYPNELKPKGKNGFFYLPNRETYNSLSFNTQLVPPATAPKNLRDLLDPRWKGKMAITSTTTGSRWIGNALETMGREFLDKLAEQDISVQDMAPASLINLVVSGEIPLSPTIFDANVTLAKQKGAPVEWRPLEPVVTTVGSAGLLARASNPHTALLFIDYLLSKEGQQLIMKGGLWSPRGCGLTGAKIQEKLFGRKVFVRRDGSEDRPVGNSDAPALHEKTIVEIGISITGELWVWHVLVKPFVSPLR